MTDNFDLKERFYFFMYTYYSHPSVHDKKGIWLLAVILHPPKEINTAFIQSLSYVKRDFKAQLKLMWVFSSKRVSSTASYCISSWQTLEYMFAQTEDCGFSLYHTVGWNQVGSLWGGALTMNRNSWKRVNLSFKPEMKRDAQNPSTHSCAQLNIQ